MPRLHCRLRPVRTDGQRGGQLRGLDRADQAAGQHGQQGREAAREAQLKRQTHPRAFRPVGAPCEAGASEPVIEAVRGHSNLPTLMACGEDAERGHVREAI